MTWRTLTRAALTLGVSAGVCSGILAGTAAGAPGDLNISMVKDVHPGPASGPFNLAGVGDTLFFVGNTPATGDELWRSDGTDAGTTMVKQINTTPSADEDCNCAHLTNVGGRLFFTATDGSHGVELWMSDGTAGGTKMVKDINSTPSSGEDSSPEQLTNVAGTLFFTADDGVDGRELWKSDGTVTGTTMVQDLNTSPGAGSDPTELESVGTTLYLSADDGNGHELWKSAGPPYSSATMVADINPTASEGSDPAYLTELGGALFFRANDGSSSHGYELWKSTGGPLTPGGTELVKDINSTATGASSFPAEITDVGGTLFFRADDDSSTHGTELWKSDGTPTGTSLVADIFAGAIGSQPYLFTDVGGTVLFGAGSPGSTPAPGAEPWHSDGGPLGSGTDPIGDVNPGTQNSNPSGFVAFANGAFFGADDGVHGEELWRTVPPFSSATLFADINQSPASSPSQPREFTTVDGALFFRASDGVHGGELWRVSVEGAPPPVGDGGGAAVPAPLPIAKKKCKKKKHRASAAKKKCKKKKRR